MAKLVLKGVRKRFGENQVWAGSTWPSKTVKWSA